MRLRTAHGYLRLTAPTPPPAGASWSFVQGQGFQNSSGEVTSISATFGSSVTAGNLLVAVVAGYGDALGTAVSDNKSNPYKAAVLDLDAYLTCISIFGGVATTGGTGVEVTASVASTYPSIWIGEYAFTGGTLVGIEGNGTANATSSSPATPSALVTGTDLILGATCQWSSNTFTEGAGFTQRYSANWVNSNAIALAVEDMLNATTDTAATFTTGTSQSWIAAVAAFKPLVAPSYGSAVVLDDFSYTQLIHDTTTSFWQFYMPANETLTSSITNNLLTITPGTGIWYSGTSTGSNTSTTLNDTTQSWPTLQGNGVQTFVKITGGTGSGQWNYASTNTATQLGMGNAWLTTPDATSTYNIYYNSGFNMEVDERGGVDGWANPYGYTQYYVKYGSFDANCSRLIFWFKPSVSLPRNAGDNSLFQIGTYIRQRAETNYDYQGTHYYHLYDPNIWANQWHQVIVHRQPQHQVTQNPNFNWPLDPEYQTGSFTNNGATYSFPTLSQNTGITEVPLHYFDGLTFWYWSMVGDLSWPNPGILWGSTWELANVEFASVSIEPDSLVSSVVCVYNGSAYELNWSSQKNVSVTYTVYYGSSNLQNSDGSYNGTGTSAGTANSTDQANCPVFLVTPSMAQASTIYFFIQPPGSPNGSQIIMTSTPTFGLY